jgi:hypothetical protein
VSGAWRPDQLNRHHSKRGSHDIKKTLARFVDTKGEYSDGAVKRAVCFRVIV